MEEGVGGRGGGGGGCSQSSLSGPALSLRH